MHLLVNSWRRWLFRTGNEDTQRLAIRTYWHRSLLHCCYFSVIRIFPLPSSNSPSRSLSLSSPLSIASTKGRVLLVHSYLYPISKKQCPMLFSPLHSVSATLRYSHTRVHTLTDHHRQAVLSTRFHFISMLVIYRASLSLEAPNYCLCIQSNSAGFSFVNTGKQVHLKHGRRHFERNLVKDVHHRSVESRNGLKSKREGEADLTPADFFLWGLLKGKVYKNTPRTIEQLKDAIRQEIQAVNVDTWEKYSGTWRNAFKCAWMWKEISFSIDYEQDLFCIVPGMCI